MAMQHEEYTNARIIRSEICVKPDFNSRKSSDPKEIDRLKENIKTTGLIHPCLLIRTAQIAKRYPDIKEPYSLVAGFRRQAALDLLATDQGLTQDVQDADYRIAPINWTLTDALMANLTENLGRIDLTSYELALQCLELHTTFKLTGKEIAQRVKAKDCEQGDRKTLSEGHINNLIRCAENLHTTILEAWKDQHPKASIRTLIAIAAIEDPAEQLNRWLGVTTESEEDDSSKPEKSNENTPEEAQPKQRPSISVLTEHIDRIRKIKKSGRRDVKWCEGAIAALRFAAGLADNIPGIKTAETETESKESE